MHRPDANERVVRLEVHSIRGGSARTWPALKGTVEMIDSGGVGLCYSVTLTNHTAQVMHEHAVGITQLVWQCWSPLL